MSTQGTPQKRYVPTKRVTIAAPAKKAPAKAPARPVAKAPAKAPVKRPTVPVVASGAKKPAVPTNKGKPINPKLPPGAPGGPPKSAGQLAFEAKERADKAAGRGRFDPMKPYIDQAKVSVEGADLPALNAIQRQIDEMGARGRKGTEDLTKRGERERASLGEIYSRLQTFQGDVKEGNRKNYAALEANGNDLYDKLGQQIGANFGKAAATTTGETDRLGLTQSLAGDPNGQGKQDQAYLQGLAMTDKTALQGHYKANSAGFDGLMDLARANAGTENYSRQAVSLRDQEKSIQDLQFELEQGMRDLGGRKLDLQTTEGSRIAELARALEEKTYGRTQEAKQQDFNNKLALENLSMSKSDQSFRQTQAAQQASQAAAAASAGPSYYEQLQTAALEQKVQAEQAAQEAQIRAIYTQGRSTPVARPVIGGGVNMLTPQQIEARRYGSGFREF